MKLQRILSLIIAVLFLQTGVAVGGELAEILTRSDILFLDGNYGEALSELELLYSDELPVEQLSSVAWRISRVLYHSGVKLSGNDVTRVDAVEEFQKGFDHADSGISEESLLAENFYWQAMNLGGLIDLRGSLFRFRHASERLQLLAAAIETDNSFVPAYYEIARMYLGQPTFLSFGSAEFAVNSARMGLHYAEQAFRRGELDMYPVDFVLLLAESLQSRNWSRDKRLAAAEKRLEQSSDTQSQLDRSKGFESVYGIPLMSDEAEKVMILTDVLGLLQRIPTDHELHAFYTQRARELLGSAEE
ncbi:hypothetical protein [Spirochaeta dissipatitropha]